MIISLIGYRGTGKSTIGRQLAQKLNLSFFDSDEIIVQQAGKPIASIFEQEGEQGFRDSESHVVEQLMNSHEGVFAWGGGVILRESNRSRLSESNHTIWLNASADTLYQRIYGDEKSTLTRPALTDLDPFKEIEFNMKKRESLYRQCADLEFDTEDKTTSDIVEQLSQWLASN